ncbi:MAG TPA: thioredoxin family protein [Anaeromyxobacteraceae bacterium]|nr:thioredoxin family protein [Anaeromyxobacteraceae bacterium]
MTTIVLVAFAAFFGLFVGLPLYARSRGRAMQGQALPPLPGPTGARLARAGRALVYFFSPSCRACRPLTPRFQDLSRRGRSVFLVNVFEDVALARALRVMGTPSVVEIAQGKVVGYHVGSVPAEVLARFA